MPSRRLDEDQERRLIEALGLAERGNRGEVRVHLEGRCAPAAPLERAAEVFEELGMGETSLGTGVLLYVAEDDRVAAVFAGPGVHGAKDEGFWQEVVDVVAEGYREGRKVDGLLRALEKVGDLLRAAAPGDSLENELPDAVTFR
jgi:uncharacterized membrane protein